MDDHTMRGGPVAPGPTAEDKRSPPKNTTPTPDLRRASELFRQGFVFREDGRIVRHAKFAEILPGPDGWAVAIGIGNFRYESRIFWPWVMDQAVGHV